MRPATPLSTVPELDHDAMMAKRFGHTLTARMRVERLIVWRLLEHLAANGFRVTAIDSDDRERVRTPKAAMELIFDLDDSRVVVSKPGGPEHTVLLILGNGGMGEDLISDWTYTEGDPDGFNAAMDAFDVDAVVAQALRG